MINPRTPKYFLDEVVSPACNGDENILKAFNDTPRVLFVDLSMQGKAYEDKALPIGMGQTISQVTTVANMLYLLDLKKTDKVLEIGTGSGFVTALLARMVNRVYSIERIPQLLERARKIIKSIHINNISLKVDDGALGWSEYAPFDKIIASAGATRVPDKLIEQLAEGGVLVIPVNNTLMKYTKENGQLKEERGKKVSFVDFVGS